MVTARRALVIGMLAASALVGCASDAETEEPAEPTPRMRCAPGSDLRLVAYGAATGEGGDVLGLTAGGEVRQLTDDGGSYDPSFSPDGRQVVFSSIGETGAVSDGLGPSGLDLHVVDADGTGLRRLLDGDEDVQPAWSPAGDRIAFVRKGGPDAGRIFVVDPTDPGSARVLVEGDGNEEDQQPTWSPDGRALAFIRSVEVDEGAAQERRLVVAGAAGDGLRTLLTRDDLADVSWSPDGAQLIVSRYERGDPQSGSATVVDVASGSTTGTIEGPVRSAVWAPTGRVYAFAKAPAVDDVSGQWRVAELGPDGDGGFTTGRAIAAFEPIDFLYGGHGIDVLRCGGAGTGALTSDADVPARVDVTHPGTGDQVAVMTREQAIEHFRSRFGSAVPADVQVDAKLVDIDVLGELDLDPGLDLDGPGDPPDGAGDLVWAVADPQDNRTEVVQVSLYLATSGVWIRTGPIELELWQGLTDLAP